MSREAAPDWLLDEFAHAGRENLDAEHVHRYDSKMDASAPSETELPGTLGLGPNSVLVEIGVGTGQLTIAAAARCDRVIAVDVSPAMLARLFANLDDRGMCNVEIVEAGFLSYLFDPESVDFVYSRLALHHHRTHRLLLRSGRGRSGHHRSRRRSQQVAGQRRSGRASIEQYDGYGFVIALGRHPACPSLSGWESPSEASPRRTGSNTLTHVRTSRPSVSPSLG